MDIAEQVGKRFGKLVVTAQTERRREDIYFLCKCDCGGARWARIYNLKKGSVIGCAECRQARFIATRAASPWLSNLKHGDAIGGVESPEYSAWKNMRYRCENPGHPEFKRYGARGIMVCERWHDFENFLADMGRRPSPELSIDRKDNNGNYEPNNCRWATKLEQRRNQRPRTKRIQ